MTTIPAGDFADALGEFLDATFMTSPVLDHDLAFGTADSIVDFDRTPLLSAPYSHLSSFLYCCWGAPQRSRSFQCHNRIFVLLVAVLYLFKRALYSTKRDLSSVSMSYIFHQTKHEKTTHCNTLQHTTLRKRRSAGLCARTQCVMLKINTLQHTATHCNTLHLTATHCNTSSCACKIDTAYCIWSVIS